MSQVQDDPEDDLNGMDALAAAIRGDDVGGGAGGDELDGMELQEVPNTSAAQDPDAAFGRRAGHSQARYLPPDGADPRSVVYGSGPGRSGSRPQSGSSQLSASGGSERDSGSGRDSPDSEAGGGARRSAPPGHTLSSRTSGRKSGSGVNPKPKRQLKRQSSSFRQGTDEVLFGRSPTAAIRERRVKRQSSIMLIKTTWMLDPNSNERFAWDLLTIVLIVYTAVAVPVVVSFFADKDLSKGYQVHPSSLSLSSSPSPSLPPSALLD